MDPATGPWKVLRVNSKGALLKHGLTGKTKPVNIKHMRRAYLREDELDLSGAKSTLFYEGEFIVVKIRTGAFRWSLCKLIETNADELKWTVQWYGTETRPRISGNFMPMWREINDETDEETAELCSAKRPDRRGFSYLPFVSTVKVSAFLPPSFEDLNWKRGDIPIKLPSEVRSKLRKTFNKNDW